MQEAVETLLASVELALKLSTQGVGVLRFVGVDRPQLRKCKIEERLRNPELGKNLVKLCIQKLLAGPLRLRAGTMVVGAVVVDMIALALGGDRSSALSTEQDAAAEGETVPPVAALPALGERELHRLEEFLRDERLVLNAPARITCLLLDMGIVVDAPVVLDDAVVVWICEQVLNGMFAEHLAGLRCADPHLETEFAQLRQTENAPCSLLKELPDDGAVDGIDFLALEGAAEFQEQHVLLRIVPCFADVSVAIDVEIARRNHAGIFAVEQLGLDIPGDELAGVVRTLLRHGEVDLHHELVVAVVRVGLLRRDDLLDGLLIHHVDDPAAVEAVAGQARQVVREHPVGFSFLQSRQHLVEKRPTGFVRRLLLGVEMNDPEAVGRRVVLKQTLLGVRTEDLAILAVRAFTAVGEHCFHEVGWKKMPNRQPWISH